MLYRIAQNGGGGNFGEFGKSGAIHQSFTHPNLHSYIIKLRVDSMTNEYQATIANIHGNYKLYS